jgi:AraC family transcriptional regulator
MDDAPPTSDGLARIQRGIAFLETHLFEWHFHRVFTISRLPDTVMQVWGTWLPASRYRHVASPDFELYDERWDPTTGEGEIDIWVPIAEEATA